MSYTLPGVPRIKNATNNYMNSFLKNFFILSNDCSSTAHVHFNFQEVAQAKHDFLNLISQFSGRGQD